jgi:hypothetical protein
MAKSFGGGGLSGSEPMEFFFASRQQFGTGVSPSPQQPKSSQHVVAGQQASNVQCRCGSASEVAIIPMTASRQAVIHRRLT